MDPTQTNNANCNICLYRKACKILMRPPMYQCGEYKEGQYISENKDGNS